MLFRSSANDLGALNTIFNKDTYVFATWDEDGQHEEEGRLVKHYKGEAKLDEEGNPYLRATKADEDISG